MAIVLFRMADIAATANFGNTYKRRSKKGKISVVRNNRKGNKSKLYNFLRNNRKAIASVNLAGSLATGSVTPINFYQVRSLTKKD